MPTPSGAPGFMRRHALAICGVTAALCASPAWAGGSSTQPPCQPDEVRAGTIREHAKTANSNFMVQLTAVDHQGHPVNIGAPMLVAGMPDGHGGSKASFKITKEMGSCDAANTTQLPVPNQVPVPNGPAPVAGATSILWMETQFVDINSGLYYLGSNFDAIFARWGAGFEVVIPDLYADTNGDGVIGAGDVLYSLVNIATYIEAIASFTEGDVFNIVNGQVAGLAGMQFSTTEWTWDPVTGFSGTPFTGSGAADSLHGLTSDAPEPASAALVALGLAAAWGLRVRRRRLGRR